MNESALPTSVTVRTGARLHFGLLARHPQLGRQHGGPGLMISEPSCEVICQRAEADHISASQVWQDRIERLLSLGRQNGLLPADPIEVQLRNELPPHNGFGSGTQTALAIGTAIGSVTGTPRSTKEIAAALGRGKRSAIGLHGFTSGGFLVDGGVAGETAPAPLIARHPWPDVWRVVLVSPSVEQGQHGDEEDTAFQTLPPMPIEVTNELSRLILMELLPALIQNDFTSFASSLSRYGNLVGQSYACVQGGIYASKPMSELAAKLNSEGVAGIVQTSWGPTIAIVAESQTEAERIAERCSDLVERHCRIRIVQGKNSGADVLVKMHDGREEQRLWN